MFRRFNHTATGAFLALLAVAFVLHGCGDVARSPVAPEPAETTQVLDARPNFLVFSQHGLRAAKSAGPKYSAETTEKVKARKGGELNVDLPYDKKAKDVIQVSEATFKVFKYSLKEDTEISMKVTGGTVREDTVVAFSPSGLKIRIPAAL